MTVYSINSYKDALTAASNFFFEITKLSLEYYSTNLL